MRKCPSQLSLPTAPGSSPLTQSHAGRRIGRARGPTHSDASTRTATGETTPSSTETRIAGEESLEAPEQAAQRRKSEDVNGAAQREAVR